MESILGSKTLSELHANLVKAEYELSYTSYSKTVWQKSEGQRFVAYPSSVGGEFTLSVQSYGRPDNHGGRNKMYETFSFPHDTNFVGATIPKECLELKVVA